MSNKLYVGSLPYSTTKEELKDIFSKVGAIADKDDAVVVITDRDTGNSKGFGFVEMASDEDAQKAITALNGSQLGDRKIVVNEARPMNK